MTEAGPCHKFRLPGERRNAGPPHALPKLSRDAGGLTVPAEPRLHVCVIGAGIVGAASAVELLRDGHRVTIIEPGEPGGEQAASYGNGTLLNPSSVIPMSAPGLWRKVPGYLSDPLGPLTIRWSYLPRLLPWLRRFLRAGATAAKVAETARALRPLLADAPERHRRLAEEAGVGDLIARQGVLFAFPSRADFEAEALSWRLRRTTASAGWNCRRTSCASGNRRCTGAIASPCWWRRTASAAIQAPMSPLWRSTRWRRAPRCGGLAPPGSASNRAGCARC